MHDCCIRVTVVLEYFKWTLNKLHNRTGDMALTMPSIPLVGVNLWCFQYDLIFKGRAFSYLIIIGMEKWYGHCASSYSYIPD